MGDGAAILCSLTEATYTTEGHKGLAEEKASGRKAAITQAVEKLGGKLEAMYFCLGENDVILITDLPDHVSALHSVPPPAPAE